MANTISNIEDVIDSRTVIARIEELSAQEERDETEQAELDSLLKLQEEAEYNTEDWKHGATLIRDSYFKDYAQELAEDVGAIDPLASWPMNCIDWDKAAHELKYDYTSVEFDGITYWVR